MASVACYNTNTYLPFACQNAVKTKLFIGTMVTGENSLALIKKESDCRNSCCGVGPALLNTEVLYCTRPDAFHLKKGELARIELA